MATGTPAGSMSRQPGESVQDWMARLHADPAHRARREQEAAQQREAATARRAEEKRERQKANERLMEVQRLRRENEKWQRFIVESPRDSSRSFWESEIRNNQRRIDYLMTR